MKRRDLLAAGLSASFTLVSRSASAQTTRQARVGWLSGGPSGMSERSSDVFKQALQELGWKLSETLHIEERRAEGDASRLPPLAAELVALRPDVIACTGLTEARALQAATRDIPIVFMQVAGDPVAAGLVESITRPGGNVTGFLQAPQLLSGKRLEVLTELLGRPPRRLAYILNPGNVNADRLWADAAAAAAKIDSEISRQPVNTPAELDSTFGKLVDRDAVIVQFDFLLIGLSRQMAELAIRYRLPVMYENQAHVVAGGLVSYGTDLRENYRQGARYVDRILKGAHPGDLPVVQASRFELILNTNAAKAIGLGIPVTLFARADEVIE